MSAEPILGLPRSRGSRPMFSKPEEEKIVEFVTRYFERGKKFSGFQLLDFLVGYLEKYPRAKKKSKTKKPSNIWFNSWQVRHPEVARFFGKGLGKRESVDLTEEGRREIVEELIQCVEGALTPAQLQRNNLELAEKVAKQVKREAAKRSPRRKAKAKKFLSPNIRKPRTPKTPRRRIKKEVHTAQPDAIEGPLTSTPSCNALVPISPVDSNSSSIGSFQISPHIHSSSGHEDHDGPSPGNAPLNLPAPRTSPLLTPKVEPGTSSEPPTAVPCTSNIPAPRTTSKPGRGRPRNKESKIRKIKNKPTGTASTPTAGTSEEATCSSTQPKKKRKQKLNDVSDVQPQVPDPDTQQAKKPRIKLFIRANNQKLSVHTPHEVAGGSDTPNPAQYVVAVRTPAAVKSTGRSRAGKQEMPDNAVPLCPIIWEVGFNMEAYDFRSWWCAKIVTVTAYRVKVHFIGWGSKYDKVYEKTSDEIRGPTTHVSAPPVPEFEIGDGVYALMKEYTVPLTGRVIRHLLNGTIQVHFPTYGTKQMNPKHLTKFDSDEQRDTMLLAARKEMYEKALATGTSAASAAGGSRSKYKTGREERKKRLEGRRKTQGGAPSSNAAQRTNAVRKLDMSTPGGGRKSTTTEKGKQSVLGSRHQPSKTSSLSPSSMEENGDLDVTTEVPLEMDMNDSSMEHSSAESSSGGLVREEESSSVSSSIQLSAEPLPGAAASSSSPPRGACKRKKEFLKKAGRSKKEPVPMQLEEHYMDYEEDISDFSDAETAANDLSEAETEVDDLSEAETEDDDLSEPETDDLEQLRQKLGRKMTSSKDTIQKAFEDVFLQKLTLTEICLKYKVSPDLMMVAFEKANVLPMKPANFDLSFNNREMVSSLIRYIRTIFDDGWIVTNEAVRQRLRALLNFHKKYFYFGPDNKINSATDKWIDDFRAENQLSAEGDDPFAALVHSTTTTVTERLDGWLEKLNHMLAYHDVGREQLYYLDEIRVSLNRTTTFSYKSNKFDLPDDSEIIALTCVCVDGDVLEPMFIFPGANCTFHGEDQFKFATSSNGNIQYQHLLTYVRKNIKPRSSKNCMVIVDSTLKELDYRAHESGNNENFSFFNVMPYLQDKFCHEQQMFIGRKGLTWKNTVINSFLKKRDPIDIEELVKTYSKEMKKKAEHGKIQDNFEKAGIHYKGIEKKKTYQDHWVTRNIHAREEYQAQARKECARASSKKASTKSNRRSGRSRLKDAPTPPPTDKPSVVGDGSSGDVTTSSTRPIIISPGSVKAYDRRLASPEFVRQDDYAIGETVYAFWKDCYLYKGTVVDKLNEDEFRIKYYDGGYKNVEKDLLRNYPYRVAALTSRDGVDSSSQSIKESETNGLLPTLTTSNAAAAASPDPTAAASPTPSATEEFDQSPSAEPEEEVPTQTPIASPQQQETLESMEATEEQNTVAETTANTATTPMEEHATRKFSAGDRVTCRWINKFHYPACVLAVNPDGTYVIIYDDNHKRMNTDQSWVFERNIARESPMFLRRKHIKKYTNCLKQYGLPVPHDHPIRTTLTPASKDTPASSKQRKKRQHWVLEPVLPKLSIFDTTSGGEQSSSTVTGGYSSTVTDSTTATDDKLELRSKRPRRGARGAPSSDATSKVATPAAAVVPQTSTSQINKPPTSNDDLPSTSTTAAAQTVARRKSGRLGQQTTTTVVQKITQQLAAEETDMKAVRSTAVTDGLAKLRAGIEGELKTKTTTSNEDQSLSKRKMARRRSSNTYGGGSTPPATSAYSAYPTPSTPQDINVIDATIDDDHFDDSMIIFGNARHEDDMDNVHCVDLNDDNAGYDDDAGQIITTIEDPSGMLTEMGHESQEGDLPVDNVNFYPTTSTSPPSIVGHSISPASVVTLPAILPPPPPAAAPVTADLPVDNVKFFVGASQPVTPSTTKKEAKSAAKRTRTGRHSSRHTNSRHSSRLKPEAAAAEKVETLKSAPSDPEPAGEVFNAVFTPTGLMVTPRKPTTDTTPITTVKSPSGYKCQQCPDKRFRKEAHLEKHMKNNHQSKAEAAPTSSKKKKLRISTSSSSSPTQAAQLGTADALDGKDVSNTIPHDDVTSPRKQSDEVEVEDMEVGTMDVDNEYPRESDWSISDEVPLSQSIDATIDETLETTDTTVTSKSTKKNRARPKNLEKPREDALVGVLRTLRRSGRSREGDKSAEETSQLEKHDELGDEKENEANSKAAAATNEEQPLDQTEGSLTNCKCNDEHKGGFMLQCDLCLTWKHGSCEGFTDKEVKTFGDDEKFVCSICKNPRDMRPEDKYAWNNDLLTEGIIPSIGAEPKPDSDEWKYRNLSRRAVVVSTMVIEQCDKALKDNHESISFLDHVEFEKDYYRVYLFAQSWLRIHEVEGPGFNPERLQKISEQTGVPVSEMDFAAFKRAGAKLDHAKAQEYYRNPWEGFDIQQFIKSDDNAPTATNDQLITPEQERLHRNVKNHVFYNIARYVLASICKDNQEKLKQRKAGIRKLVQAFATIRKDMEQYHALSTDVGKLTEELEHLVTEVNRFHDTYRSVDPRQ